MVGITARSIPHAEVRQQRTNDRRELSGDTIEHSQTPLLMNQDIRRRKDAKMPRGGPKRKPDRGSDLSNRCLLLSPKIRENHDPATVRHSFEQALHGFHTLIVPYSCEYGILTTSNQKRIIIISSVGRLEFICSGLRAPQGIRRRRSARRTRCSSMPKWCAISCHTVSQTISSSSPWCRRHA